ncbi:hypothetical protein NCS56_01275800 [Fusarium sp. Ph1]|nr:hypothetical protein NCS56_01275800 [Fusarium sp. Ph1]
MPPIWGKKYLEELGLESWEQVEKMAEQALQEKDRQWDAEAESRRNQNTAQRTHPRLWRINKTKVRKTARNEAQHEHQTVASTSHDLSLSLPGDRDSLGGMSEIRSVHDSPNVNDAESSSGDKSESTGPEDCHTTDSGDTTSSDDSGTTHQEATPERDVDVDMDE